MLQISLRVMAGRRVAPRALPPERQAFLAVHAIEALFTDVPAFAPQQHQQPVRVDSDTRLGQFARPLAQSRERILPARVVRRATRGGISKPWNSRHSNGSSGSTTAGRGGPRNSDRLLRWDPDQGEGVWNATEETELSG